MCLLRQQTPQNRLWASTSYMDSKHCIVTNQLIWELHFRVPQVLMWGLSPFFSSRSKQYYFNLRLLAQASFFCNFFSFAITTAVPVLLVTSCIYTLMWRLFHIEFQVPSFVHIQWWIYLPMIAFAHGHIGEIPSILLYVFKRWMCLIWVTVGGFSVVTHPWPFHRVLECIPVDKERQDSLRQLTSSLQRCSVGPCIPPLGHQWLSHVQSPLN